MFTQKLIRIAQSRFVRQMAGAMAGALIALSVYTAYDAAHDAIRAHLLEHDASQVDHPAR